jgi:hypothetical protein
MSRTKIDNLDRYHSPFAAARLARFNKRHIGRRFIARIVNARFRDDTVARAIIVDGSACL